MTDTPKHTPGPWKIGERTLDQNYVFIHGANWDSLARVVVRMKSDNFDCSAGVANAHLIAAAPELLQELQNMVEFVEASMIADMNAEHWKDFRRETLEQARDVLDKAIPER